MRPAKKCGLFSLLQGDQARLPQEGRCSAEPAPVRATVAYSAPCDLLGPGRLLLPPGIGSALSRASSCLELADTHAPAMRDRDGMLLRSRSDGATRLSRPAGSVTRSPADSAGIARRS